MTNAEHQMTAEADNGHEILFACNDDRCGRRFVFKRSGGLVVIDQGDPLAVHSGSMGPVSLSADLDFE